ncbi:hypothetical protein [Tuwongella immobilis]|uniref:Uncharacterized protein n=1 Tax=Tuwongella immobilis TaxID=692036 RepID=A0A6C2YK88_9BACT|nr:hypothetical protein [Tuwongella immobilis]VIP01784.1 Uncharacterized protein OS=Chamaesiphon minutus PCC 6605 GN=Cha6605_2882 PE=4 SV=1 [Tuwongella immobilis]VTR99439.1 Uncharacterized protein OS=Chamaesiphon minutus PCC 6605 GN=Cha6605_2882 PE=4 SV=1 [Tuwongella immobilis]
MRFLEVRNSLTRSPPTGERRRSAAEDFGLSTSFDIMLSKPLAPDDLAAALADLIPPSLRVDVRWDIADLIDEPGALWALVGDTHDPAWPRVLSVLVCREECGLGPYPDLRVAVRLWERFGADALCGTYPFAGERDPNDPYWSLACIGGRWYLASTCGTRLMGPYTDGTRVFPGDEAVRLVRPVAVPE